MTWRFEMFGKLFYRFLAVVAVSVITASVAEARKLVLDVSSSSLSTYTASDPTLGDYYVLQFQVPRNLQATKLEFAILELYLDVSAIEKDGYLENTPTIEIYALGSEFSGELDASQVGAQTLSATHNVAVGSNRKMMLDITKIVRSYLQDPTKNHGLIIGSLTGTRDGVFSIRTDALGQGAVARIFFLSG